MSRRKSCCAIPFVLLRNHGSRLIRSERRCTRLADKCSWTSLLLRPKAKPEVKVKVKVEVQAQAPAPHICRVRHWSLSVGFTTTSRAHHRDLFIPSGLRAKSTSTYTSIYLCKSASDALEWTGDSRLLIAPTTRGICRSEKGVNLLRAVQTLVSQCDSLSSCCDESLTFRDCHLYLYLYLPITGTTTTSKQSLL